MNHLTPLTSQSAGWPLEDICLPASPHLSTLSHLVFFAQKVRTMAKASGDTSLLQHCSDHLIEVFSESVLLRTIPVWENSTAQARGRLNRTYSLEASIRYTNDPHRLTPVSYRISRFWSRPKRGGQPTCILIQLAWGRAKGAMGVLGVEDGSLILWSEGFRPFFEVFVSCFIVDHTDSSDHRSLLCPSITRITTVLLRI